MDELILILFLVFSIFVFCVVILTLVKKCTVNEAVKKCKKFIEEFLRELFGLNKFQLIFPLLIGFDEFRRVNYSYLDLVFKSVAENFNVCYLIQTHISEERGLVRYKFHILRSKNIVDEGDLQKIICAQVEKIASQVLNDCGLSATSVYTLVHVEMQDDVLIIAFALNYTGIAELEKRKRTLRLKKMNEIRKSNSAEFSEKWNHYENN